MLSKISRIARTGSRHCVWLGNLPNKGTAPQMQFSEIKANQEWFLKRSPLPDFPNNNLVASISMRAKKSPWKYCFSTKSRNLAWAPETKKLSQETVRDLGNRPKYTTVNLSKWQIPTAPLRPGHTSHPKLRDLWWSNPRDCSCSVGIKSCSRSQTVAHPRACAFTVSKAFFNGVAAKDYLCVDVNTVGLWLGEIFLGLISVTGLLLEDCNVFERGLTSTFILCLCARLWEAANSHTTIKMFVSIMASDKKSWQSPSLIPPGTRERTFEFCRSSWREILVLCPAFCLTFSSLDVLCDWLPVSSLGNPCQLALCYLQEGQTSSFPHSTSFVI